MGFVCLHDKQEIGQFLRKNLYLNIYSIGDLDDFFWPYTIWYGLRNGTHVEAVALLYFGQPLPVLLALLEQPAIMQELLKAILHLLPPRFYAHLSIGLEDVFSETHNLEPCGEYYRMALQDTAIISNYDCSGVVRLSEADVKCLQEFYDESYPENSFDSRMLETKQYFGALRNHRLVSVAGVHVCSSEYGVAALGNIATRPPYRGMGYGKLVTARVCQSLLGEGIDHIGLNVKADNAIAISCYEKLGFEIVASFGEFVIQLRQ